MSRRAPILRSGLIVLVFAAVAAIPLIRAQAPLRGAITVDASTPGARIPPNLNGIFFEEISHAGDGGLYAERGITAASRTRLSRPPALSTVI